MCYKLNLLILVNFLFINLSSLKSKTIVMDSLFPEVENIKKIIQTNDSTEKMKNKIDRFLKYKGYSFSSVTNISVESNIIKIELDEGRVNKIKISGNRKISFNILKVYIRLEEGDIFNERALKLQIKKLYNTGLFDKITYNIYKDKKMVLIKIKEKARRYFDFSADFHTILGVAPSIEYTDRSVFNFNLSFKFLVEFGILKKLNYQKYRTEFLWKDFLFSFLYRNGLNVFGKFSYNEKLNYFILSKKFILSKNSSMNFGFNIEEHIFDNTFEITNEYIISGLRYGFELNFNSDNKRDVIEEFKENHFNFSIKFKMLPEKNHLYKIETYFKKYSPLSLYLSLIYKTTLGYVTSKTLLPFDEKFLIGGENQRGYFMGEYISNSKFENSLQIEYEFLIDKLFVLSFLDNSIINFDKKPLILFSSGLGMRIFIWNYTISIQYGFPAKNKITEGQFFLSVKKFFY